MRVADAPVWWGQVRSDCPPARLLEFLAGEAGLAANEAAESVASSKAEEEALLEQVRVPSASPLILTCHPSAALQRVQFVTNPHQPFDVSHKQHSTVPPWAPCDRTIRESAQGHVRAGAGGAGREARDLRLLQLRERSGHGGRATPPRLRRRVARRCRPLRSVNPSLTTCAPCPDLTSSHTILASPSECPHRIALHPHACTGATNGLQDALGLLCGIPERELPV